MSIQEKGELPNQQMPEFMSVHGPQQVKNAQDGFTFAADPIKRLTRFLCLGTEGGTACTNEEELKKENVTSIENMIAAGRGEEAVETIRNISVKRRCAKQKFPVFALAICARANNENTRKAAYRVLPDVCRIPTDMFLFVRYCKEESGEGGWGRSHRRGVSGWYQSFKDNPLRLARLVTKYRTREKWSHRDVIRLAHPKVNSLELGFIFRYITKGLEKAMEPYKHSPTMVGMPNLQQIHAFLEAYEVAQNCPDVTEVCRVIREHHLDWQHVNNQLLSDRTIWEALLGHIPIEALLRNLGLMTSLGLFNEDETHVETVILRLNNVTNLHSSDLEDENEETGRTYAIHPFKILLACETYRSDSKTAGCNNWIPNKHIHEALMEAFHKSFQSMTPTGKKYCLAIDVGRTMGYTVLGVKDMKCYTAAALMILTIIKVESRFDVFIFSDDFSQLNIDANDDIKSITKRMQNVSNSAGIDCALPMTKAVERKVSDYDVFCIYTCNDTYYGKIHPAEALRQYREYSGNPNVKLVVCAMNSKEFTIADPLDDGMLDVVGFDAATPEIIARFCQ
ncbi:hypothetical protein ACJMK2_023196 [Sinanodonta woodiana]|uniref:TROVE domain-containing protein n=1 Tax=Sinanodonta woodiana TaxID=1069815 RepID=A0ABD3T4D3_SINWO